MAGAVANMAKIEYAVMLVVLNFQTEFMKSKYSRVHSSRMQRTHWGDVDENRFDSSRRRTRKVDRRACPSLPVLPCPVRLVSEVLVSTN